MTFFKNGILHHGIFCNLLAPVTARPFLLAWRSTLCLYQSHSLWAIRLELYNMTSSGKTSFLLPSRICCTLIPALRLNCTIAWGKAVLTFSWWGLGLIPSCSQQSIGWGYNDNLWSGSSVITVHNWSFGAPDWLSDSVAAAYFFSSHRLQCWMYELVSRKCFPLFEKQD